MQEACAQQATVSEDSLTVDLDEDLSITHPGVPSSLGRISNCTDTGHGTIRAHPASTDQVIR